MLRNRIFSGETVMAISFGSENGIPTPLSSPQEFVPIHQMSLQWPMWGQYAETNGNSGQPVDMPQAEKLLELYDQWQLAQSREQKVAAWRSEEHTSELQSLMRISYAVFCLKKKKKQQH